MVSAPNQQEDNLLGITLSRGIALNRELALWLAILLLALFTRFHMLGDRVMSHDESLHTRFAYNLYNEGNFQHTPLMHGPVLFHATAFSYFLFGDSDFSGRAYTAALGVLMVMFPLLLRKWLGRWGALLAGFMLLISPLLLYYNRYIRHDTPSILFGMVMAYCILMYLDGPRRYRGRAGWLYLFAAAMILNLGSKETAFIYIAIFGSFLLLYFLVRLAQRRYQLRGRTLFSAIMLGILLGGVMTLGMYIVVDVVHADFLPGSANWTELSALDRASWLNWTLLSLLSGLFVLGATALYAFRDRWRRLPWRELALIFLLALFTTGALLLLEEVSHVSATTETAEPADPDEQTSDAAVAASAIRWAPGIALWLIAIGLIVVLIRDRRRARSALENADADYEGLWRFLRRFPETDFLVLILTLVLPWTTALFVRFMGGAEADFSLVAGALPESLGNLLTNLPNMGSAARVGQFIAGASVFVPLLLISLAVGLSWNWRRWLVAAAIFHLIFAFFFTTVFTNIAGLGTGMIYSLGYWLEQQGVRRGSQPQYYYLLIILPTYEFLPVIGSVSAMFAGLTAYWKRRRKRIAALEDCRQRELEAELAAQASDNADLEGAAAAAPEQPAEVALPAPEADDGKLRRLPFLLLLAWWAVLNLVGYSLAGEKMPWLGTHLTTPMIFISAWYFGGLFSRIDKTRFAARGWLALLVLPPFAICLAQVFGAFIVGDPPFAGLQTFQLERTFGWLAALATAISLGYLLVRLARLTGWLHLRRLGAAVVFALLSLLTARAAWMASFINYDLPTELLVYAHAGPAVKWVLDDITEMSLRLTDGKSLKFAYDDEVSWPYSWYFRDFTDAVFVGGNPTLQNTEDAIFVVVGGGHRGDVEPILEDRYYRRDYMRMWWPMQEYFGLTPQRLMNVLDFSPGAAKAAELRRGIFDIWWARDYDRYGEATGKDFSLTNWPVSDRMHVYVRKDFAAKIWEYGLGDGLAPSNLPTEVNLCVANWQAIMPILEFDASEPPLANALGISVSGDRVFVADEKTHLAHEFNAEGDYLASYGGASGAIGAGGLSFNRPNSVVAMPNGDLLVVDTWNYRVQRIDPAGSPVMSWGSPGEFGFDAPSEPTDGFWGPRDVALDGQGRVFIADTGNKRVRVYRLDGGMASHEYDIGGGGSGPGELDEPSGLAIHSDGRLFVADTWNRRVAVFDVGGGHISDFRVRGWYNTTFNRPYLALHEANDSLYVSDPDAKRILVYTPDGDCLGAFGEAGGEPMLGQFSAIGGIAVDEAGFVYVSDSSAGRVLKFPPFPRG